MPSSRLTALLTMLFTVVLAQAQTPSEFIHVDQFGYLPTAQKVAVLSDPQIGYNAALSFTPSATLEVRNATSNNVVFSGVPTAWNGGATHLESGDRGWWFDFSSVIALGDYYILDPASGERSGTFSIRENVYEDVLYHAARMFYYNRANESKPAPFAEANWQDGPSFMGPGQDTEVRFVDDSTNATLFRDLSGGWFDAGDHNKYVTFAEEPVHNLLSSYQENPAAWQIDLNIPESGNAMPDILDEVKVELDWLFKMNNPDGSTIIKMGNRYYDENDQVPPSANVDPRYYGPTCTAASLAAAAMFAHAAIVYGNQTGQTTFANELQSRSIASLNWAIPALASGTLDLACDDGRIKAGDADRSVMEQVHSAVVAMIYLRELTGDTQYDALLDTYMPQVEPIASNWWFAYRMPLNDALLFYMKQPWANPATVTTLQTSLSNLINGNDQGVYGFGSEDLYRGQMPDWSYHWGSNSIKAAYGNWNQALANAGYQAPSGRSLGLKAAEQIHHFHGLNPMGLVQLSAMEGRGAERGIQELYHLWFYDGTDWDNSTTSAFGPAPGYLTGGSNQSYATEVAWVENNGTIHWDGSRALQPPYDQPAQKSYIDTNDEYGPDGEYAHIFSITEPAIYYQAAYLRLLANYAKQSVPLPVEFLYITAESDGDKIDVEWAVAVESNIESYVVERSESGTSFDSLAAQTPFGANSTYTYADLDPLPNVNYYRIKVLEEDGLVNYSPTVSVQLTSNLNESLFADIVLAPNPTGDELRITATDLSSVSSIEVIDAMGRVVLQQNPTLGSGQLLTISTANLTDGSYTLRLNSRRATINRRFVKR